MSDNSLPSTPYHVRRRHFIDRNIQGRLIAGLVLIEVVLFAAAMWFIYYKMQFAIDQELYRVHQLAPHSSPVLLHALYQTIPWIILVNVLVLVGIDWIWGGYVEIIIGKLRCLAHKVAALDLRSQLHDTEHEVLRQARHWLDAEQTRCQQIRQLVQALPDNPDPNAQAERQQLLEQLQHIRQRLG
jgi:hypothetical protein